MSNCNKKCDGSCDKAEEVLSEHVKKIHKATEAVVKCNPIFVQPVPKQLTVQLSKRGPLYSKVLDGNGTALDMVTEATVALDLESNKYIANLTIFDVKIETID